MPHPGMAINNAFWVLVFCRMILFL